MKRGLPHRQASFIGFCLYNTIHAHRLFVRKMMMLMDCCIVHSIIVYAPKVN
ncbi:MAG: hypothetical protein RR304_08570 [Bacteroides sp.]